MHVAWTSLSPPLVSPRSLILVAGDRGVLAVSFAERGAGPAKLASLQGEIERRCGPLRAAPRGSLARRHLRRAVAALEAYFRGALGPTSARCDVEGRGSPFDERVWRALREIPAGEVRTYGELAAAVGCPGAARAVGGAVARNPIPILLPCHRVVGARGTLTGFGPGVGLKALLLEHEGFVLGTAKEPADRRIRGRVAGPRKGPAKGTWRSR
jgi:methylated-DNA-[protein]-cysteine S-methyltransferase